MNKAQTAILSIVVFCTTHAISQVPGLARVLGGPPAAAASAPEPATEDWPQRLSGLQQSYAQWRDLPDPAYDELRRTAERLIEQLGRYIQQRKSESGPGVASAEMPALVTAGKTAPFSMLDVDALRDQRDHGAAQQRTLGNALVLQEEEVVLALAQLKKAGEMLRLRQERLARAPGEAADAALTIALDLARVQQLQAELQVAQAVQSRTSARLGRDAWNEPLALMDQEIERVRPHQQLKEQDLALIREQTEAAASRWESRRLQAAQTLSRLESGRLRESYPSQTLAYQARVRALLELRALARGKQQVWEYRQQALAAAADPQLATQSGQVLDAALTQIATRLRAAEDRRDLLLAEQRSYTARQMGNVAAAAEPVDAKLLADLGELIDLQEQKREQLARVRVLLTRSREDLNLAAQQLGLAGWVGHAGAVVSQGLTRIWQYELFSATESSQVNGQTVTVDYGVTVGKSIGVVVLFLLGYWVVSALARLVSRQLVRRAGMSEALARVLDRWVMSLLVIVVFLVVLRMARVPLTLFAFLGGALAIGFGFGAQNVIKNLISGAIILFERKVRVGDVVTIGGISGTVTAVDLRASTVHGFDGVMSIVPNSFLLEQQVSSWSFGEPALRRSITVGVAYGSDTALTIALIQQCAQEHPMVLADPPAAVLLEDFAADSLLFRLNFWIAHSRPRTGPEIESDLRLAIEAALSKAGLNIPFPQRDVHLRVAQPIQVHCTPPQ
ncbi:MAG: mechanosensitive ion channel [Comamonadaceae bacterium]|nr:mechanosensitive ion channel [Comamonadaceae bacterium]